MPRRWTIRSVVAVTLLAATAWDSSTASAGPLADWWNGLHQPKQPTGNCAKPPAYPAPYYPQPGMPAAGMPAVGAPSPVMPGVGLPPSTVRYAPAPTTAYYAPMVAAPVAAVPTTVGYAPAAGYPVAAGYAPAATPPCPTCQRPVVVNYAPYTAYRSTWMPLTSTVYRPVVGLDPATGRPATVVQPYTATQWQLQRVPVNRPFVSMYQPLPVSGYAAPAVAAPAAVPAACPPGCPTCPNQAAPYGAGWGAPAGGLAPGSPTWPPAGMPATGAPGMPPAGGSPTSPPTWIGPPARTGANPSSGYEPADRPPSLSPGGLPPSGASYNYPPAPSPTNGAARGGTSVPGGASAAPAVNNKPAFPPPPQDLKVKPLPDPDAVEPANEPATDGAKTPQLITPRERTAARESSTFAGDGPTRTSLQRPHVVAKPPTAPQRLDDSGWQPVAR